MADTVHLDRLEGWLTGSLSSSISQAERERVKIVTDTSRALASLTELCGQVSQKATRDMESKKENLAQYKAARSIDKLAHAILELVSNVKVQNGNDTSTLRGLQRELSRFAADVAQVRSNWLKQIRPYYIIDMMTLAGTIDKIARLSDTLHNFLMGTGMVLKHMEELKERIASLKKLQDVRDSLLSQHASAEAVLKKIEAQESLLREEDGKIRKDPRIEEYLRLNNDMSGLRIELLRTAFSRMSGPLKKFVALSERGEFPIPVEVREDAKSYLKKPFTTFLQEETGYPRLIRIMTELSNAVSSGRLPLKPREAKKVIERTEQVVSKGLLTNMHARSKEAKRMYDALMADPDKLRLVERFKDLKKQLQTNRTEQDEVKHDLDRLNDKEARLNEQLNSYLKNLESFSRELSGEDVKLKLAKA